MGIKRYVTATRKDNDGDITHLCSTGAWWSPRPKQGAIDDIESGQYDYWVAWGGRSETQIRVVRGPTGKYLRTDRDATARNNLADLPDC